MSDREFVGFRFPLSVEKTTGKIVPSDAKEDIKQSLFLLLNTRKGERIYHPDYGCDLEQFAFEGVNYSLLSRMEKEILEAIKNHEPRVKDVAVSFQRESNEGDGTEEKLIAQIDYQIKGIEEWDELSLEIPLE